MPIYNYKLDLIREPTALATKWHRPLLATLLILALTGIGVVGGLLFVFSNCVMRSFKEMPGTEGMRAMQIINRRIQNPLFFLIFMGTTVVCLAVIGLAAFQHPPGMIYAIAGAASYVLGGFGITVLFNVPMNNRLDTADLEGEQGQQLWQTYLRDWTRWNHIRTVFCIAAVVLLALAV